MRKNSIMRKALSAGLCVAMSGLLLAGCQSNSASETTAAAQTTAAAEAEEAGEAEATEATEAAEEAAPATDFPTKEIEFIVPVNPGGSSDTVARALAKYAEEYLGQPMVVTNMAGGASTLGTAECINSEPDGYTLVYPPVGAVCVQPHYGQISYTYTDLTPICQISEEDCVLVVPKDTFATLEDLVAYGKENPGAIKYGNSSQGGPVHMVLAKLFNDEGIESEAIGYQGSSEVKAALMGGHITAGAMHPAEVLPIIESGDVVPLAISTSDGERNPSLPDVPTFKELGYDITFTVWKGVFGPADMPAEVVAVLEEAFNNICTDEEFVAELDAIGQTVDYMDTETFTEKVASDFDYYGQVIDEVGMKEIMNAQ